MRIILFFSLLLFTVTKSLAQDDSTFTDLGRTSLRKEFLQGITIKGADLERLPFSSLNEVIGSWLYGVYSNNLTLGYVVDGNLLADVNIYSIHDIEEITMVQNATSRINGPYKQQQLILIKTKRPHSDGSGITFRGATHREGQKYFDHDGNKRTSTNEAFHQYEIAAFRKRNKASYGLSAGFLREAMPMFPKAIYSEMRSGFNRLKASGYFGLKLGAHHRLDAKLNGVRQRGATVYAYAQPFNTSYQALEEKKNYLNAEMGLHSSWGNGYENSFDAGFTTYGLRFAAAGHQESGQNTGSTQNDDQGNATNFLVRNTLSYKKTLQAFEIRPAIGFTGRWLNENMSHTGSSTYNGNVQNYNAPTAREVQSFLLTTSVDMLLHSKYNLQLGIVSDVQHTHSMNAFPYISLGAILINDPGSMSVQQWKVFSSFSEFGFARDHAYVLANNELPFYQHGFLLQGEREAGSLSYIPSFITSRTIEAGSELQVINGRLDLSYHFDQRDFLATIDGTGQPGSGYKQKSDRAITHRFEAAVKLIETQKASWRSVLHTSIITNKVDVSNIDFYYTDITGDVGGDRSWTGGWTNRLRIGHVSAGLDLLYHFSKKVYDPIPAVQGQTDLIAVQNAYLAFAFKAFRNKEAELYVSSRNPVANKDMLRFMQTKQFYGVGFRAGL